MAAVTFAIRRDYLLYIYSFMIQFIHATYFNCIYIIIIIIIIIISYL